MKRILLSFILSVAGLIVAHADGYTGILVDDGSQKTYYLFSEQPTVKYENVGGVINACLYVTGVDEPLVSVPLTDGAKLSVSYDAFVRIELNDNGFATFSAKDASTIATEGVTAYKAAVSGETITLTALEGNIPAATGVLLYGEGKGGAKVNLPVATYGAGADVIGNDLNPTTLADGSLTPTVPNSWVLGSDNAFHKFSQSSPYKANRAYLVHTVPADAPTRALSIGFGDGTTSLDNIDSETSVREEIFFESGNFVIIKGGKKYNLTGQVIE